MSTASKVNKSTTRKTGTSFSVTDEGVKRLEWRGSDINPLFLLGLTIGISERLIGLQQTDQNIVGEGVYL